jgi:hypothetical protein
MFSETNCSTFISICQKEKFPVLRLFGFRMTATIGSTYVCEPFLLSCEPYKDDKPISFDGHLKSLMTALSASVSTTIEILSRSK